jgi:hypothetical protein
MAESKSAALPLGYAPMLCLSMIFSENRLPLFGIMRAKKSRPKHEFVRAARTIAALPCPINARHGALYGISAAFFGLH